MFLPFWVCRLGEIDIILCVRIPGRVIDNEAFGFLVPSSQPEPILGCIYDTSTFRQVPVLWIQIRILIHLAVLDPDLEAWKLTEIY